VSEFAIEYASRVLADDIDVRDTAEGRTVYGTVVPYGRVATVNDGAGPYREMFAPGAFSRSIAQRAAKVKLLVNHDGRKLPVGVATKLEERDDSLYGEFLVSRAQMHLIDDVSDGILDSFSVGFRGIDAKKVDGVVIRTEAALREVSLVGFPAYADALIGGVRMSDDLREQFDRYLSEFFALADPGTGTDGPPNQGTPTAAVRAAQLRALDLITLKGRS
jgi:HK97 family phage prohead protease